MVRMVKVHGSGLEWMKQQEVIDEKNLRKGNFPPDIPDLSIKKDSRKKKTHYQ